MPGDRKLPTTPKITSFTTKSSNQSTSLKRSSSAISPLDQDSPSKKPNLTGNMATSDQSAPQVNFQQLIEPIMLEFKSLKDTMATQKGEISEELEHHKTIITNQKEEIISEINFKVDTNSKNIIRVLEENKELKRKNDELKDRVSDNVIDRHPRTTIQNI